MNTKTVSRTKQKRHQRKAETLVMIDDPPSSEVGRTRHNPTTETYNPLDYAHAFMNEKLFNSSLPKTLITLQRIPKTYGFYDHERFSRRVGDNTVAELALNPRYFKERTDTETVATLVHEMVHQLRAESGDKPRRGYHDKAWAQAMKNVGLYPSSTGEPSGGKETGSRVSHYIVPDGPFSRACAELISSGWGLSYVEVPVDEKKRKAKRASHTKYQCPSCAIQVRGKPDISITCTACQLVMPKVDED
jgi:predicted SprT family Zn-dependent metalloprotease